MCSECATDHIIHRESSLQIGTKVTEISQISEFAFELSNGTGIFALKARRKYLMSSTFD